MKKFIKYIFGMILFLGFANGVGAEQLFKCKYSVDFSKIVSRANTFSIEVVGEKDGTTSISSFDNVDVNEELGGHNIVSLSKTMKKDFYKYATEQKKCPKLHFTDRDGTIFIELTPTTDPGTKTMGEDGTFESSEIEEAQKEIICDRQKQFRNESNFYVKFVFYKLGDQKKWEVSLSNAKDAGKDMNLEEQIFVSGYTFDVDNDSLRESLYTDKCKTVPFYLRCNGGSDSHAISLTSTYPDDGENCAFGINDAPGDDGSDFEDIEEPTHSTWAKTDGNTLALAKRIYEMVKIIVPVLIIILSIVDFLKVVLLSDDKNYKAAWSKFIKRIVIGIIFFVVPALIALLLNIGGLGESGILNVFA